MKLKHNKKLGIDVAESEAPLEAIETLQQFFECDMWYAKGAEWKTEKKMLKYLKGHFKICKDNIKKMIEEGHWKEGDNTFMIEKLPGPPGKREILRARKS